MEVLLQTKKFLQDCRHSKGTKKKSTSGAESRTKNTGQHLGSGLKPFLCLLQSFCKMFLPFPAAQGHLTVTVTAGAVPQPLHDLIQNAEGLQGQGNLWLSQGCVCHEVTSYFITYGNRARTNRLYQQGIYELIIVFPFLQQSSNLSFQHLYFLTQNLVPGF